MRQIVHIFRDIFVSFVTVQLIISMAGFVDLAQAVSCNDLWYTVEAGNAFKYSDKLRNFTSYNGKTYAYGITTEKITSGVNSGKASLYGMQSLIAESYPGASLAKISDGRIQKMLTDVFGPLIKASAQSGVYVGLMNKNDGLGYVNMDGSGPASYYNWALGQPNPGRTCTSSDGVVGLDPYTIMQQDGAWKPVCDGSLTPLFEFPGVFDCAVPYTGSGSTTATGASNFATGPSTVPKSCDTNRYESFGLYENNSYAITKRSMTWEDAKSLAEASGGKLTFVANKETNNFLTTQFGPLMTGSAKVTGNKAWIGLHDPAHVASWCYPDIAVCPTMPERFLWVQHAASSFSNWAVGQPDNKCTLDERPRDLDFNCSGENWAAMGQDGTWSDEGNHGTVPITLKAIVQWDGQLSCTSTINVPPPPPTTDLGLAHGQTVCSDSFKGAARMCDKTDSGTDLCPLEKKQCADVIEPTVCLDGGIKESGRHVCQLDPAVTCPVGGYIWDKEADKCVMKVPCPDNGEYNPASQRCEKNVLLTCALSTFTYNSTYGLCEKTAECDGAGVPRNGHCETPVTRLCSISGYIFNNNTGKCEMPPYCQPGSTYSYANKRCEKILDPCSSGYAYDTANDTCTAMPTCSIGDFFQLQGGICTVPQKNWMTCEEGWTWIGGWWYTGYGACKRTAECASGGSLNPAIMLCDAGNNVCSGWTLNTVDDNCFKPGSCPGGVLTIDGLKCVSASVSSTCSDMSGKYSYDYGYDSCIAPAKCTTGAYNPQLNSCVMDVSPYCGNYAFNGFVCYKPGTCPQDPNFVLNSSIVVSTDLNKCASDASHICTSKYAYNGLPVVKCEADDILCGYKYNGVVVNECDTADPNCVHPAYYEPKQYCPTGKGSCLVGNFSCEALVSDTPDRFNPDTGLKYLNCSPNACTTDTQAMIITNDTTAGAFDPVNDGVVDANGNCNGTIYLFPGKDMRCRIIDRTGQISSFVKLALQAALIASGVGAVLSAELGALGGVTEMSSTAGQYISAATNAALTISANMAVDASAGVHGQGTLLSAGITMLTAVIGVSASTAISSVGSTTTSISESGMVTSVTKMGDVTSNAFNAGETINTATIGKDMVFSSGDGASSIFMTPLVATDVSGTLVETSTVTMISTLGDGSVRIVTHNVETRVASMSALYAAQAQALGDKWGPTIANGMLSNYSATECCYPDDPSSLCEPEELSEMSFQHDKWCHIVGTYCAEKLLGMCIVRKETSCCFNSMLGRIFHEQGRTQLMPGAFAEGWGDVRHPICRGFTPEEFQNLDFSARNMDLSEYIAVVADKVQATMSSVELSDYMTSVTTNNEEKFNIRNSRDPNAL
jgi:conjugal transfer mating pair stabilization protein TraN